MSRNDDVNVVLGELDEATTALGTRVQGLIDQINKTATDGLNGPQTESVLAHLASFRDSLNGMGKNPADPLPDVPPAPPAVPGPFA